jgi:hypothetical protein
MTDSDFLWSARMIVGEAGEKSDKAHWILWAMINRFLLHKKQELWSKFEDLLKAFSQPINPKWVGEYCQEGGKGYGTPACDAKHIARRHKIRGLTLEEISDDILEDITAVFHGELFLPQEYCRISNWHKADNETRIKYPHGVDVEGNWFFEEHEIMLPGHVKIEISPYEI